MNDDRDRALKTVREALGGARVGQLILAAVVLGLAWLFTLSLDASSGLGSRLLVYALSGLFVAFAAVLLYVAFFKNSPSRSPLIVALVERPGDVVWVYEQDVQVNVNGIAAPVRQKNVITKLVDGKTVAITVAIERAGEVVAALRTLAPLATVGFSEDLEAQFKRDPSSLAAPPPPEAR